MLCKKRFLLILDFEANCSGDKTRDHEICEFPVVLVDSVTGGDIVGELQFYVKAVHLSRISPFIEKLTGITDENIEGGISFEEALYNVESFLVARNLSAENCQVVTCGDWDLKTMFPRQVQLLGINPYSVSPTVMVLFQQLTNIKFVGIQAGLWTRKVNSMEAILRKLGLSLQGRAHCGLDDCRNIAQICKSLISQGIDPSIPAARRNYSTKENLR